MSTRSYPFAACFAFPFVSAILFFFAFSRTEHSVDSIRLCADIFSHWICCLVPNGAVDAPPKNMRTDAHLFDAVYWIYNCQVRRTFVEIELYYSSLPRARYAAVTTDNDFRWCCVCSTPAKVNVLLLFGYVFDCRWNDDTGPLSNWKWSNNFWFIAIDSARVWRSGYSNDFHHFPFRVAAKHPTMN